MKFNFWLLTAVLSCVLLASCGGYSNNRCSITAVITPATVTADHSLAPPGNQAQFSLKSSVSGFCPLVPDKIGTWSSSDPLNVSVNNQGLATCQNVSVSVTATIGNDGWIRGHAFTPATLTCK